MKITVFTPTYNRGYIIENLYRSLQKQIFVDFEWLVIDDGSNDDTDKLFALWRMEKNTFPIRYCKVENGGKHRAINKAVSLAQGELFFIVDSDDYLTEDALESIQKWEQSLENKELYCGISGNRGKSKDEIWGTTFEGVYIDATSLEREKYNINGDKAEAFYTKILKKYKFYEFQGENFITESTVWNRMAHDGYKIRWFNQTIYISDYLNDGLVKSGDTLFANNPQGTACLAKQQIQFYKFNLIDRLSIYNSYYKLVRRNISMEQAAQYLEVKPATLLWANFLGKSKKTIMSLPRRVK